MVCMYGRASTGPPKTPGTARKTVGGAGGPLSAKKPIPSGAAFPPNVPVSTSATHDSL